MSNDSMIHMKLDAEKELRYLKSVRRMEIACAIRGFIRSGDISEGSGYDRAKQEQEDVETQIRFLESCLHAGGAEFDNGMTVQLGCIVHLQDCITGQTVCYRLVNRKEDGRFEQELSAQSSLGKLMLGKTRGSFIEWSHPFGKLRFKIISIQC